MGPDRPARKPGTCGLYASTNRRRAAQLAASEKPRCSRGTRSARRAGQTTQCNRLHSRRAASRCGSAWRVIFLFGDSFVVRVAENWIRFILGSSARFYYFSFLLLALQTSACIPDVSFLRLCYCSIRVQLGRRSFLFFLCDQGRNCDESKNARNSQCWVYNIWRSNGVCPTSADALSLGLYRCSYISCTSETILRLLEAASILLPRRRFVFCIVAKHTKKNCASFLYLFLGRCAENDQNKVGARQFNSRVMATETMPQECFLMPGSSGYIRQVVQRFHERCIYAFTASCRKSFFNDCCSCLKVVLRGLTYLSMEKDRKSVV